MSYYDDWVEPSGYIHPRRRPSKKAQAARMKRLALTVIWDKKGVILFQELQAFMESIPGLSVMIARSLEVSPDQVLDLARAGKLNFEDVQAALDHGGNEQQSYSDRRAAAGRAGKRLEGH